MYTRRHFLVTGGSLAAATVIAPDSLAQALSGAKVRRFARGTFPDGVISGDPTPNGITLWTRLEGVNGKGSVRVEVARDRGFRHVVAHEDVGTSDSIDHTVKVRLGHLKPDDRYFYRFETKGSHSPVGRFQTALPADSRQAVRFGVISCLEFTFGYFNALRLLAKEDVDFVINLGDYIYADLSFVPPTGVRDAHYTTSPGQFSAHTLDQYRQRYQVNRSDPDLRAVQAKFPMVNVWDDHEVQNNYSGGDPKGGTATGEPYSVQRRNTAYRAFFEQMPTFPVGKRGTRLYHTAHFGRTMDLFVLDERQYRASNPCGDVSGPACANLNDPRAFLGPTQLSYAKGGIQHSKATWKVIANEVLIMPVMDNATTIDDFDLWDGFPVERESLLRTVADVNGVVFVTGDYHAFLAGSVQDAAGRSVATEFAGGSITSPSDPEIRAIVHAPGYGTPDNAHMPPDELARRKAASPWLQDLDYDHHGYFVCEASRSQFKATFKKLQTVRQRSTQLAEQRSWTVHPTQRGLT